MRLDFAGFKYKIVHLHGIPITYLFIVFTMHALGQPPACYCEEPGPISKDGDDTIPTLGDALWLEARHPLPEEWQKVLKKAQRVDYTPFLPPTQPSTHL